MPSSSHPLRCPCAVPLGSCDWFLALRTLGWRSGGFLLVMSLLSLLGIALGVAAMIVVLSVMGGFSDELLARVLGLNGHFTLYSLPDAQKGAESLDDDARELHDRIAAIPGVTDALFGFQGDAIISSRDRFSPIAVRAMREADLDKRPLLAANLSAESRAAFSAGGVLLGVRLAERLNVGAGDRVTLLAPGRQATALGLMPRFRTFSVAGTFRVGMYEFDRGFLYMPLTAGREFLLAGGGVGALEIFIENPRKARHWAPRLEAAAGRGWQLVDWQENNAPLVEALNVERNVSFVIVALVVVVAAFNILSGQYMLVRSKQREIAILRTMGAPAGLILRCFFLSGAAIGLLGSGLGLAIGLLICRHIERIRLFIEAVTGARLLAPEVYSLTRLPARIEMQEVAVTLIFALTASLLAPLLPAWRASRLEPVAGIRNS